MTFAIAQLNMGSATDDNSIAHNAAQTHTRREKSENMSSKSRLNSRTTVRADSLFLSPGSSPSAITPATQGHMKVEESVSSCIDPTVDTER